MTAQRRLQAAFYRGGTSKGLFFHGRDLPDDPAARDRLLLAALGSPDPYGRQLDGMGGGISSLSKAAIIAPSTRPDADIDYTFAQVAVDRPVVDYGGNCGNLTSAVGPFAVDEGLVPAGDGERTVRIFNTNTNKLCAATFAVAGGQAVVAGSLEIAGVAGTGASIRLDFLDPGGSVAKAFLPTGRPVDVVELPDWGPVAVTLADASNPVVFAAAGDLGADSTLLPDAFDADRDLMARLDRLRRIGGTLMGLAARPEDVPLSNPKIALVDVPRTYRALDGRTIAADGFDVAVRMVSMERMHKAVPLTGGMCLAAACKTEGSVPHALCRNRAEIRIAQPSGLLPVAARVAPRDGTWIAESATVYRTARRLMEGAVLVPHAIGVGRADWVRPPLPPNRTCGSPASGSPVDRSPS